MFPSSNNDRTAPPGVQATPRFTYTLQLVFVDLTSERRWEKNPYV